MCRNFLFAGTGSTLIVLDSLRQPSQLILPPRRLGTARVLRVAELRLNSLWALARRRKGWRGLGWGVGVGVEGVMLMEGAVCSLIKLWRPTPLPRLPSVDRAHHEFCLINLQRCVDHCTHRGSHLTSWQLRSGERKSSAKKMGLFLVSN